MIETLDGGNPLRSTRHVDVAMAIESLRYNAGWATKLTGETALSQTPSRSFTFTLREPIGVVGAITPWNAPFLMAVNKIGPALAAGCTVVLKPAELAPLSALRLAQLIEEIELPPGVVNVVTGYGQTAGQALVDHPDVNKISFTGSTRVGKSIVTGSAAHMKRVTLELGGKSPVVVFPDADIEAATRAISRTIFFKTGQFCMAGTRLFAHEKVFDEIASGFEDLAAKVKIGAGIAPDTEMGPIISQKQLDRVLGYIDAGRQQGARGRHRRRTDRARRLLRSADAARQRASRDERVPRRDLRARAVRDAVRRRERARSARAAGERHELRSRGEHLDARHRQRDRPRAPDSAPATSR